ncbi:MAG: hypothetical protein AMXMBFR7_49400 [Planctomycetota bacterium]
MVGLLATPFGLGSAEVRTGTVEIFRTRAGLKQVSLGAAAGEVLCGGFNLAGDAQTQRRFVGFGDGKIRTGFGEACALIRRIKLCDKLSFTDAFMLGDVHSGNAPA